MTFLTILWLLLLLGHTFYSYEFLYRTLLNRPLSFYQAKGVLSVLEILIAFILALFLIRQRMIPLAPMVLAISWIARAGVKRLAYNRELRAMAVLQEEANKMSHQEATDVAKILLDLDIESGRR